MRMQEVMKNIDGIKTAKNWDGNNLWINTSEGTKGCKIWKSKTNK